MNVESLRGGRAVPSDVGLDWFGLSRTTRLVEKTGGGSVGRGETEDLMWVNGKT